jgi:uncharacterized membrane protein (UPF0127 family)
MKTGYISINNHVFDTLLAISSEEQSQGLMYQEPPVPVMSFVYAHPQINKFWMRSTPAPLDIIFCHQDKVSQIYYGEPHSTRIIGDNVLSDLVIELPYGTVKSANLKVGQEVSLIKPSKEELRTLIAKLNFNYF